MGSTLSPARTCEDLHRAKDRVRGCVDGKLLRTDIKGRGGPNRNLPSKVGDEELGQLSWEEG